MPANHSDKNVNSANTSNPNCTDVFGPLLNCSPLVKRYHVAIIYVGKKVEHVLNNGLDM